MYLYFAIFTIFIIWILKLNVKEDLPGPKYLIPYLGNALQFGFNSAGKVYFDSIETIDIWGVFHS